MHEMKTLISIFVPALIIIIVRWCLLSIKARSLNEALDNAKKKHVVIHLPKAFFWIGFVESIFFVCFMVLGTTCPNIFDNKINIWFYLLFSCLSLFGLLIMLATKIWKIDVYKKEDYFIYRSFLGSRYTIYYSDCISYIDGNNVFILKTRQKKFYIDSYSENLEFLVYQLNIHHIKKCKARNNTDQLC